MVKKMSLVLGKIYSYIIKTQLLLLDVPKADSKLSQCVAYRNVSSHKCQEKFCRSETDIIDGVVEDSSCSSPLQVVDTCQVNSSQLHNYHPHKQDGECYCLPYQVARPTSEYPNLALIEQYPMC